MQIQQVSCSTWGRAYNSEELRLSKEAHYQHVGSCKYNSEELRLSKEAHYQHVGSNTTVKS